MKLGFKPGRMGLKSKRVISAIATLAVGGALVTGLAACEPDRKASATDTYMCICNNKENSDHGLLEQVPPGQQSKNDYYDAEVIKVQIPTSNRFYMMATDAEGRDPGAPAYIEASAQRGTA